MENETPSLPANYVTLAQLEERWLKEQQRKQIEKQRQIQQQQQELDLEMEKTERDRKDGEDDVKNRIHNGGTTKVDVTAPTTITRLRDRRYQNRRNAQESQIQPPSVDDVAQMADESMQQEEKKRRRRRKPSWKKKRDESRPARVGAGETAEVQPPEEEEEVKKVVVEKAREVEGAKSKIQINGNGSGRKGSQWIEKEKVVGDNTASPIVQNFEGLSVNGGKEGNVRPLEGRNGRNGGSGRDSGKFHARGERQQGRRRDGNLVWVKKGESTDAGVNGVQC